MSNKVRDLSDMTNQRLLPATGFVRLAQIIGNPKVCPPIPPIIPVSKSSWWEGVKTGKFPQPIKLGPRTTVWRIEDIVELIDQIASGHIDTPTIGSGESHGR